MAIKTERGLPSIDGSVGHLYRPPGGRQAEWQNEDGDTLKKRLPNPRGNEQALWHRQIRVVYEAFSELFDWLKTLFTLLPRVGRIEMAEDDP